MNPSLALLIFTSRHASGLAEGEAAERTLSRRGYCPDCVSRIAYDDGSLIGRCLQGALDFYAVTAICCPQEMAKSFQNYFSENFFKKVSDFAFERAGKRVYILCRGNSALTPEALCDALDGLFPRQGRVSVLRCVGVPDAVLHAAAEEAKHICPDARLNAAGLHGDCRIELATPDTALGATHEDVRRRLLQLLGDYIYAMEDVELNARLVEMLKLRKMHISVAESFTGGGVGRKIVQIPGASEVFDEGLNTYSNRAKMSRLGVDMTTLNRYGAVSQQTAKEMALGLLSTGACDVALSTTGIAGPASDNTLKPVGLIYIGCGTQDRLDVYEYRLKGSREEITETAINLALFHAYMAVK